MIKPYYQDEWVTIYHLTSEPKCANLSLDKCTEVSKWIARNELGDTEQDSEGKIYPSEAQGLRKDISKRQNTSRNASDLGQSITHIRAKISLLNLGELELYVVILSDLAKDAVIQRLRGIIRMAMRETIAQRISASYAEDAICLRTGD